MMNKMILALAGAIFATGAFAQSHVAEAQPQTDSKPQMAAEAKKMERPKGVVKIKDGSSARGQGSGVRKANKPEMKAEARKETREAMPHRDPVQGGTPD